MLIFKYKLRPLVCYLVSWRKWGSKRSGIGGRGLDHGG